MPLPLPSTVQACQIRPPQFSRGFHRRLEELLVWRRDVRHFRNDPVSEELLDHLLDLVQLAPSVGNSQPWRFVRVRSPAGRASIKANFEECNKKALAGYTGERAKSYAQLKLAGLDRAPVQLAVFADGDTFQGLGLGRLTMPETLTWSVVGAIHILWLAARSRGLGLGWVSILDPLEVRRSLDVPPSWTLTAYLCLGWPEEQHDVPELARLGWQDRTSVGRAVLDR